ncbi:hypothetical protein [Streptomyces sp. XY593]|uniref:hypothetical protein n=1 Tax=Streptomyces sp. XY593 TaxID=1519483 RepID=UPI000AC2762D|nr:hypothetical protein [Streptomyces sp. XY593]
MLRRLRDCSTRTQAEIAASRFLVATSLSNHLNGGRIPTEPQVTAFFEAIEDEVSKTGAAAVKLPCTLAELLELRRLARAPHCACVPHTRSGVAGYTVPETPASPSSASPAGLPSPRRRGRRRSSGKSLSRTAVGAASARRVRPVPLGEGDRPHTPVADTSWAELKTINVYLADGKHRDAGLLLWRAGRTLDAADLVKAVGSCRTAGLNEAAESVLTSASERADRQAVLNIAAALGHAGREQDVAFLLNAATRGTR